MVTVMPCSQKTVVSNSNSCKSIIFTVKRRFISGRLKKKLDIQSQVIRLINMLKKLCRSPQKVHSVNSLGVCAQYHHNRFFNMFFMLPWVGQFLMKDFQTFLPLIMFLLTFLSFKSLLMTSFHVFLGRPLPLTLKVPHLLDQAFSSILYI